MIKKLFFMYLATFLIIFGSCFGMQKDNDDDYAMIDHKDLKTIFHENKAFFEKYYEKSEPTSQHINRLLFEATLNKNYDLVVAIVNAMKDIIENYKQLYAAIRAGKKGLATLRKLLEAGVSPHGFAQPGHDGTIHFIFRIEVEKPPRGYSAKNIKSRRTPHST